MARTTAFILLSLVFSGCTTTLPVAIGDDLDIDRIHVDATSKRLDGSTEMITRCSGFILSEKTVRDFFTHAARIKEDTPDKYYRILPCSSTGTAVINKRKYNWIIRAGGIGEISSDKDRFVMVCGKNCCNKVPGIC